MDQMKKTTGVKTLRNLLTVINLAGEINLSKHVFTSSVENESSLCVVVFEKLFILLTYYECNPDLKDDSSRAVVH